MSNKGIELDISVQGTDLQKSVMETQNQQINNADTRYTSVSSDGNNATESFRQTKMPKKGKITKILLVIGSNSLTGASMFTLRKNGANGTPLLQFAIPATNNVNQESVIIVEFDVNDLLGWEMITAGVGAIIFKFIALLELEA